MPAAKPASRRPGRPSGTRAITAPRLTPSSANDSSSKSNIALSATTTAAAADSTTPTKNVLRTLAHSLQEATGSLPRPDPLAPSLGARLRRECIHIPEQNNRKERKSALSTCDRQHNDSPGTAREVRPLHLSALLAAYRRSLTPSTPRRSRPCTAPPRRTFQLGWSAAA